MFTTIRVITARQSSARWQQAAAPVPRSVRRAVRRAIGANKRQYSASGPLRQRLAVLLRRPGHRQRQYPRRYVRGISGRSGAVHNEARRAASSSTARGSAHALPPRRWALGTGLGVMGGTVGSLLGVGGALLILPVLTSSAVGMAQLTANATALAGITAAAAMGTSTYAANGHVDWVAGIIIAASAAVSARFAARWANSMTERTLKLVLGYSLMVISPMMLYKNYVMEGRRKQTQEVPAAATAAAAGAMTQTQAQAQQPVMAVVEAEDGATAPGGNDAEPLQVTVRKWLAEFWSVQRWNTDVDMQTVALLLGTGCFTGVAAGVLGIGGGVLMVTVLALTTTWPHQTLIGTSLLAMVVPAITASIVHYRLGNISRPFSLPLIVGAALGGVIGANAAIELPQDTLRWIFAVFVVLHGLASLRKGYALPRAAAAVSKQASTIVKNS